MARTRAERRHSTHVKTSARKAKSMCSNKISLNGEAASCPLCNTSHEYMADYHRHYVDLQIDSFMKAID